MPLYNFRFTRLRGLTEPVEPVDPGTGGGTGGNTGGGGDGGSGAGTTPGMTASEHEAKGALAHDLATTERHGFMSSATVALIGNISIAVNGLTQTVNDHSTTLNELSTRLDDAEDALSDLASLASTVGGLGSASSNHTGRIETLESQQTTQGLTNTSVAGTLSAYNVRFEGIENTLSNLDTWADNVDTSLGNLSTAVNNQSTAHGALASRVSTLETGQGNLQGQLSGLNDTLSNQQGQLSSHSTTIGEHESRLDVLEAAGLGEGGGPILKVTTNSSATVYSFVKADTGKYYRVTAAVPAVWTVPTQATVAWVDGEELQLRNLGPETLTLDGAVGVTLVPAANGTLVLGAGMAAVLRRVGENLWDVFGQTEDATPFDPDTKVDKVDGKGLSTNDYTNEEKTKLAGLAQPDWNATSGQPGHILNKPVGLGGQTIGDLRYSWMDFDASAAPWTGAAISSGTVTNTFSAAMVTADPDFYGVILLRCTATANTGYRITNSTTQLHLTPGMHYTSRFMIPIAVMTTAWMINGLNDASAYADPVDGVYLKLSGLSCNFVASSNSVRTTGAAFSIVQLKWYVLHIDVISSSEVRFSVYNDTDNTLVFAETLTTNIPAANATRALGAGVVVVGSHPAVADVMALDWIGVGPVRHTAFGAII